MVGLLTFKRFQPLNLQVDEKSLLNCITMIQPTFAIYDRLLSLQRDLHQRIKYESKTRKLKSKRISEYN